MRKSHHKPITIIVYGADSAKAKELARQATALGSQSMVLDAAFVREAHEASAVKCLPCVHPHDIERLRRYWPDLVQLAPGEALVARKASQPKPAPAADPDADAKAFIASQVSGDEDAERAGLAAEAERLGIKIDGRWGAPRLRDEIAKATQAAA